MNLRSLQRPRFISAEEAIAWHEIGIAQYGGAFGLRDRGALESALAMPCQSLHGEYAHAYPFEMAAAYAFHLAKNHPFVDGNKRIALLCCGGFLRMNGWNLRSTGEAAADKVIAIVEGHLDKSELANWLRENCAARPSMELRDFFAALTPLHLAQWATPASSDEESRRQFEASFLEAMRHFPLLRELQAERIAADKEGRKEEGHAHQGVMVFLTALYRIAEDMGYEW